MSIQHVGAVLYHMPELREQSAAFALAAIADSADRGSGWSFHITLKAIADAARLKVRAVRYALRELERRGYLRTEGKPGRSCRFRLLFDHTGKRKPESELYPTPAPHAGVAKTPRHQKPGGAAPYAGGAAPKAHPPNNPPIGVPVLSPSSIQRGGKNRGPKKMPGPEAPPDYSAEKQRQAAAVRAKLAETGT